MSREKSACPAIETMLTTRNFMDAQKRFDAQYNENEKALITQGFLEYLLHNIRQFKEAIVNAEYYKENYTDLMPKDKYQEKLFSLNGKVNSLVINSNQSDFKNYDKLYDQVLPDGSNICYCVWLYNKGNFRTEGELVWASNFKEFYNSGLYELETKSLEIRLLISFLILLSPLILCVLGWLLAICLVDCKFTGFCFAFSLGILYAAPVTMVIAGVVALIVYFLSGIIYNLSLPKWKRELKKKMTKDTGGKYLLAASITAVGAAKLACRKK